MEAGVMKSRHTTIGPVAAHPTGLASEHWASLRPSSHWHSTGSGHIPVPSLPVKHSRSRSHFDSQSWLSRSSLPSPPLPTRLTCTSSRSPNSAASSLARWWLGRPGSSSMYLSSRCGGRGVGGGGGQGERGRGREGLQVRPVEGGVKGRGSVPRASVCPVPPNPAAPRPCRPPSDLPGLGALPHGRSTAKPHCLFLPSCPPQAMLPLASPCLRSSPSHRSSPPCCRCCCRSCCRLLLPLPPPAAAAAAPAHLGCGVQRHHQLAVAQPQPLGGVLHRLHGLQGGWGSRGGGTRVCAHVCGASARGQQQEQQQQRQLQ